MGTLSVNDFQTHAAGGSLNHSAGAIHIAGVEVLLFLFTYRFELCLGNTTDFILIRYAGNPWRFPLLFFSREAAGGLLVTNSKLRSL